MINNLFEDHIQIFRSLFKGREDHFHHQGQCVHEDVHEHLDGLRFKILSPDYL